MALRADEASPKPQFFGRPGGNISQMALRVGEESLNPQFFDDLEEYQLDDLEDR
jgi:hypothetical protein